MSNVNSLLNSSLMRDMQGELIVRNASIAFREPNGTSYRCRVTLLTGIRYPDPGLISSYRLYKRYAILPQTRLSSVPIRLTSGDMIFYR